MLWKKDKLFCEINPLCFKISLLKEIFKRHIQNILSKEKFAKTKQDEKRVLFCTCHRGDSDGGREWNCSEYHRRW